MTTLRAAAQQALEFIKATNASSSFWLVPESNLNKTVKALRAALAEPVQEPVIVHRELVEIHPDGTETWKETPLYTHPPHREWRGLTEEEINEATFHADERMNTHLEFARAIEQALKEKNHE